MHQMLSDLQKAGHGEGAGATTTDILLDESGHGLEDGGNFLAAQAGVVGDGSEDFALRPGLELSGR